ncbi:STAS domain-containing protein [Umezawaea endophytica]|uniref:STAS domain-containing protein n=1 Tax=Umezawaea endophytica TaxID=1654476 RepID=A0A9X2VJS2_9PSEU|nr:STAS domain-containing protein [Umezawaea endophytica]MCS7477679.1 STAS domain-containing protein [Umezawaea endophytica]
MTCPPTTERLDVVPADGDLDMISASDLAIDLGLALSARPRAVIADLTAVRFVSAAGLSVLERAHHHAETVGSRFVVVAAQRCVLLPLALTGLDAVLSVFPDVRAVVEGLMSGAS